MLDFIGWEYGKLLMFLEGIYAQIGSMSNK